VLRRYRAGAVRIGYMKGHLVAPSTEMQSYSPYAYTISNSGFCSSFSQLTIISIATHLTIVNRRVRHKVECTQSRNSYCGQRHYKSHDTLSRYQRHNQRAFGALSVSWIDLIPDTYRSEV
jgi:hypothetical protein